ncbi:glycoside hydrolase family 2 protein [Ferruginibacter sp.]
MRINFFLIMLLLHCWSIGICQNSGSNAPVREKININREWKFKLGDFKEASKVQFGDADWDNIHLPHNFSIPYFQSAQWYTGYGWYRKYFNVPEAWHSKRISVEFEGAFREAEIFVNGELAGSHNGGYTGFSIDITKQLKTGNNVLAVRLNNNYNPRLAPRNGDHNFTGGIYRDVYLVITNDVHITWYGTFVTTPGLSKNSGPVRVQTEIRNDGDKEKKYTLKTIIADPNGKPVSTVSSQQNITPGTTVIFDQTTDPVKTPKLWHPDHPSMYKVLSILSDGKRVLDKYESPFGFRWVKWTADSGFFLNGERYYFKGANVHQDHAGWASAVTNAAIARDVKMVKDCGMDFIRGSHYPHDPAFSEACDNLGVLFWEENDFWGSGGNQKETDNWYSGAGAYPANKEDQSYFEESVKSDLREMIRIHRNHPSIIVWSMCNEPFFTGYGTIEKVRLFLKQLTQLTHQLDATRLVGIGGCQRGGIDTLGDVAGYNGDGARLFINPKIPNVVTEYGSTIAKRPGRYFAGWGDMAKQKDSVFAWRSGEALWCAFDYGTRASGDFGLMGMIDYFRVPKNQWYWYRNEYAKIPPPPNTVEGTAYKLRLTADKKIINGTDGTDDVFLLVTVLDKDGKALSNSPEVTLKIVSGPGEFPTGTSITFNNTSDIYIRDGKAAIEFRNYYAGNTVIKAFSQGLQSDSVAIKTIGTGKYVKGVTPEMTERPYVRYVLKQNNGDRAAISIAAQKPTRASSEAVGKTANLANDRDSATAWQSNSTGEIKWWQVDLENLYTVAEIRLLFPSIDPVSYKIELSKDNQYWEKIAESRNTNSGNKQKVHTSSSNFTGRFLRITFTGYDGKVVTLNEVEILGKTAN